MTPHPLQQPAGSRSPSSMPIVALVFSVLGFCLPPLLLVGIILGIVALVQRKGSQAPAIIAVVLPVLAIPVVGILAAIAIPNFIKFQARSKQSECKANLKAAYTGLRSYEAEKGEFSLSPKEVGFSPMPGNRYLYTFSAEGTEAVGVDPKFPEYSNAQLLEGIPADIRSTLGIQGTCPECTITVACAGNVDTDKTIDVWTISTGERAGIPAGMPHNDVNDITD